MDKSSIISKVNEFLEEEFEVENEDITGDANLKDTLELDSLDYVDLVVSVESNFGVKLDADDFVDVITLQNFYDLIDRKVN
ncbi:MAG: phosphopantetheine-binding protein [Urechidicola sp.]|nr:phosphopantetheine-binding protein [Urechidicola sp.]